MKFTELKQNSAFDKAVESIDSELRIIVCGAEANIDLLKEGLAEDFSSGEIIEKSNNIEVAQWFGNCRKELEQEDFDISELEGKWPGEIIEKPGFTLDKDILTDKPLTDLVGTEIDCDESWQVLAHFNYGGWNECPMPEVHCAIWKYWEERFGAKIVGVSGDIIEAFVSNPPQTQEEAMALAWEQYFYCPDVVEQGMETVANLAALLIKCETWYFWWD